MRLIGSGGSGEGVVEVSVLRVDESVASVELHELWSGSLMLCRLVGHKFWFQYFPGGPRRAATHCVRCGQVNR